MKSSNPLVSIVIPVYNVENYLDKCMSSVLGQKYKKLDIILVDDGSTDDSGRIIDEYAKKYKCVKAIHKRNGGLSSARNAGIKHASGDWLAFVDSDDYIKNDFISKMVDIAKKQDADVVTCSFEPFSNDGSMLKKSPTWPSETMSGRDAVKDMLKNKRPAYVCLCMFKKTLFLKNDILFPDGHEYEDMATKIKLLYHADRVSFTNDKLYFYLIRKESITGKSFSESRYRDFVKAINDIDDFLSNVQDSREFEYLGYFKFSCYVTLLNYLAKEKNRSKENRLFWRKIRLTLKTLYKIAKFPTVKKRILGKAVLAMSTSKTIYSIMYKRVKR